MNEELRGGLREMGALTRDPRVKERKKYGRKRAPGLPVLQALVLVGRKKTATDFRSRFLCS